MSDFEFSKQFKTVEKTIDGEKVLGIKLLENPYDGIIFSYGKVDFHEDYENDKLRINFEYDVLENPVEYVKEDFELYIGDLLQELIYSGLQQNNLVYTGGIDGENREDNIIESDSQ